MEFPAPQSSKNQRHHERTEEMLTHLAAEFIVRESNGTSLITATRTVLSSRGDGATVFVSVFPDDKVASALEFLNRQAGDFREYLKAHARMRDLPRIEFAEDYGEKNRQHLDELGRKT